MLNQHIALVPEAGGVNASELARVCAALQKQLTRDLLPTWGITATIDAFPHLEDVPLGYWPIIITFCDLGDQAGVHIDRKGQPYAQVEMGPGWSLQASQACLEMLINPFGRRLVAGPSPRPDHGPVEYLLEIGAPCSSADCGYLIDDVLVSDFCTPAFWGAEVSNRSAFSFTGAVQSPHQVLPGGHLTWHDPITDRWWLRHHSDQSLVDTKLGSLDGRTGVVREAMRLSAPHAVRAEKMTVEAFEARLGVRRQHALRASQFQAHRLRSAVASGDPGARELESGTTFESEPPKSPAFEGRSSSSSKLLAAKGAQAPRGHAADDEEVEVTRNDLLKDGPPAEPVRSRPPPLPEEARVSEKPRALEAEAPRPAEPWRPAQPPQFVPAQSVRAPTPATISPSRPPEQSYVHPSTVPPMSMGQVAGGARLSVNTWLLVASMIAAAGVSFLTFTLYARSTSTLAESPRPAAPAPQVLAPTTTITAATIPSSAPAAIPPVAIVPATAQPLATSVAAIAPHPEAAAAPATTVAAVPPSNVAPVAVTPAAAPMAPRPTGARVAAPARPRAVAAPTDDSDPLEGLIGERR